MAELRERFEDDLKLRGRRPNSIDQYLRCIRSFGALHRRPAEELGTEEVRAFLLHLEKTGRSPGTRGVYYAALKFLYDGTLERPEVMADIPGPRPRRPLPKVISRAQVRQILGSLETTFDRAYFSTMYAFGLRSAETEILRADDIQSMMGLIWVPNDFRGLVTEGAPGSYVPARRGAKVGGPGSAKWARTADASDRGKRPQLASELGGPATGPR